MLSLAIPKKEIPDTSSLQFSVCDEPFVEVASYSGGRITVDMQYYRQGRCGSINEAYLRLSVAKMLVRVAENLPNGYKIKIYDAWRPFEVQKDLFDQYLSEISLLPENLGKSQEELVALAKKFVSLPDRKNRFAYVHSSGGAVDLTLTDENGVELDMGCGFDDFSDLAATDAFENDESSLVCKNRRILYNAMTEAGFTNYPPEWWHYDFGDLFWAASVDEAVKYPSVYSVSDMIF